MKNKFRNIDLNNPKIENIINAAYEEFAKYSTKKASLNNILSKSGVSKGGFYHHFKNKDELYEFLTFFAIKSSYEALNSHELWREKEIIKRTIKSLTLYYVFSEKFPYIFEFLNTMTEDVITDFIEGNKLQEYNLNKRFYSENIDLSFLKSDVDQEKFITMTQIVIGDIGKKHFKALKFHQKEGNLDGMVQEMESYGEFLRLGYYK